MCECLGVKPMRVMKVNVGGIPQGAPSTDLDLR